MMWMLEENLAIAVEQNIAATKTRLRIHVYKYSAKRRLAAVW